MYIVYPSDEIGDGLCHYPYGHFNGKNCRFSWKLFGLPKLSNSVTRLIDPHKQGQTEQAIPRLTAG